MSPSQRRRADLGAADAYPGPGRRPSPSARSQHDDDRRDTLSSGCGRRTASGQRGTRPGHDQAGGPTTFTGARARVDVDLEGERFEAGSQRLMFYAAANHDPRVFPDPDRFDIARQAKGHLAFSAGPHYCLGAPLARMEAEIGLSALFRRIPALVTGQPVWRGSAPVRQIESLPSRTRTEAG